MISIPFREAHNALKGIESVKRNAVEAEVKVLEEEKQICEKGRPEALLPGLRTMTERQTPFLHPFTSAP